MTDINFSMDDFKRCLSLFNIDGKMNIIKTSHAYSLATVFSCGNFIIKIIPLYGEYMFKQYQAKTEYMDFLKNFITNNVEIIPSTNGSLVEHLHCNDQPCAVYVMKQIKAIDLTFDLLTSSFVYLWGKETAQLHQGSKLYTQKILGLDNHNIDKHMGWLPDWNMFEAMCKQPEIRKEWLTIKEAYCCMHKTIDTYGFTHNDNQLRNVMHNSETLYIIDYDYATFTWYINDIANAVFSILEYTGGVYCNINNAAYIVKFINDFCHGYGMKIDHSFLTQLDFFIHVKRMIHYLCLYNRGREKDTEFLYQLIVDQELRRKNSIRILLDEQ